MRPTGWCWSPKAMSHGSSGCRLWADNDGQTRVYSVPYSEHSSFSELRALVGALRPRKLTPTVNSETQEGREKIMKCFSDIVVDCSDRGRLDHYLHRRTSDISCKAAWASSTESVGGSSGSGYHPALLRSVATPQSATSADVTKLRRRWVAGVLCAFGDALSSGDVAADASSSFSIKPDSNVSGCRRKIDINGEDKSGAGHVINHTETQRSTTCFRTLSTAHGIVLDMEDSDEEGIKDKCLSPLAGTTAISPKLRPSISTIPVVDCTASPLTGFKVSGEICGIDVEQQRQLLHSYELALSRKLQQDCGWQHLHQPGAVTGDACFFQDVEAAARLSRKRQRADPEADSEAG